MFYKRIIFKWFKVSRRLFIGWLTPWIWYVCPLKQPSRIVPRKRCSENILQLTGEHPCPSLISIKLQSSKIALRHGCSPVNLQHIFRKPFCKNTCRGLLLFPGKIILWKRQDRFIHLLSPKFSTPNSWYIVSRKESLIAPLFANAQLYWTRLVFSRFFYIRGNLGNAKDFYLSSHSLTEEIRLF